MSAELISRSLADVIADRTLELHAPDGPALVRAEIGRPVPDRPDGLWVCGLRVRSPGRTLERLAVGGDALDALRVAFQMVRQELLDDLPRLHGTELLWQGQPAAAALPNQFP
jgi:hypothetical protein